MNPQWTLRRRVTALSLLVATVLTFMAVGAATTAIANRGQVDELLDDVGPMRRAANDLLSSLVTQETAVRAYVLSGAEGELAPYVTSIEAQRSHTAAVANARAATPEIRALVGRVSSLADTWRTTVAEPAIAAVRRNDPGAGQLIVSTTAIGRFEEVRRAVEELQVITERLRDDAVASIRGTSTTLLFVLIVAVILVIAGGVALLVFLQRAVIGPVTDLAAEVREVADGNYHREIAVAGSPELERLARDVDSMRRRIVADLAEVQAARGEIERTNALLEQQAAELVRSNGDLEQFAYVASHDLQEPLRKVSSFCQLLQRRYAGQLDERADQYIEFAVNGAQRMQRLINDLLAFSRIGRVTTGFTDVDLGRVVADLAADVAGQAPDVEITWAPLPVVRGEEALLLTLMANLIGNSLKFRRPDVPPRIRVRCRKIAAGHQGTAVADAQQDAGDWEIGVEDNGIGIDAEFADKVFVIFQRLHGRDDYPGTGIGLAVAKKIVEYHGGIIWIDREYAGGAAIRFTLPVAAPPVADPPVVATDVAEAPDMEPVS
jgi:signal transduction histidine kinase